MADDRRNEILATLRAHELDPVELPDLDQPWTVYDDPLQQFIASVQAVGGKAIHVRDVEAMNAELENVPHYGDARKVASLVEGIGRASVDLQNLADPHDAEDIDFFIAPGEFGVAENGAVWVTDHAARFRVLYFIVQHLVLTIATDQIVNNLPEAYQRLSFREPGFGLFLSGPSKTADIEQSLVIGAHGARSLTVFCLG